MNYINLTITQCKQYVVVLGYLGNSRVVLNHFDAATQVSIKARLTRISVFICVFLFILQFFCCLQTLRNFNVALFYQKGPTTTFSFWFTLFLLLCKDIYKVQSLFTLYFTENSRAYKHI